MRTNLPSLLKTEEQTMHSRSVLTRINQTIVPTALCQPQQ